MNNQTTTTNPTTCEHKLFNCNCWYVVGPDGMTLIHQANNYDLANQWRLAQPDAGQLKMTPWTHGREVVSR